MQFVDQSSRKFKGRCRGPLVFTDDLGRLSISCFVHKIFALRPKSWSRKTKCKNWPPFLRGTPPTFLRQILSVIYCPPFSNVWLSSVCWSPSAKPGNEVKQKSRKVGKNFSPILSRLWTKVHNILRQRRIPVVASNALARSSIPCSLR